MGWKRLVSGVAVAVGALFVLGTIADRDPRVTQRAPVGVETVRVGESPADVTAWEPNATGAALSRAAFGLSALQPETYNGEIVLDIIDASPLALGEKDRLSAKLLAAEAGHARLPEVLEDIRLALAVE